jgi:hypothetical protein
MLRPVFLAIALSAALTGMSPVAEAAGSADAWAVFSADKSGLGPRFVFATPAPGCNFEVQATMMAFGDDLNDDTTAEGVERDLQRTLHATVDIGQAAKVQVFPFPPSIRLLATLPF